MACTDAPSERVTSGSSYHPASRRVPGRRTAPGIRTRETDQTAQQRRGLRSACGVTTAGAAYCWGWNFYGEVGDGTTTLRGAPVVVAGGHLFRFSAGSSSLSGVHSCGVTTDNAAYCWGYNFYGQLGDGTTEDRSVSVAVADAL